MMPVDIPRRPQGTPFERIGGREVVERIVDAFYDGVEADPLLRPLFPEDMTAGRERQKAFLEEWLGGAPRFSTTRGHPMLRRRHFPFEIGPREAGRWLHHMRAAFESCDVDPALTAEVFQRLGPLAHHMINQGQDVPREPLDPPAPPPAPR
jgi:hemoglobin